MVTIDSNIVVYAFDERDPLKQHIAIKVLWQLRQLRAPLALQVVGEFRNVAHRKLKMPITKASAIAFDLMDDLRTFPYDDPAVRAALDQSALGRAGFWDAVLLASAADAGCTALVSEDMRDGATLFGLEIVNPFAAEGLSPRAAELLSLA